jgi:hypothetical protein
MKQTARQKYILALKSTAIIVTLIAVILICLPYHISHYIGWRLLVLPLCIVVALSAKPILLMIKYKNIWTALNIVKSINKLTEHLVNAGIYAIKTDDSNIVVVPTVDFAPTKNNNEWLVMVKNSLAVEDKLMSLDVTAGLQGYVQDGEPWLTDTHSHVVYRVYDVADEYRYTFNSFDDVVAALTENNKDFVIDKRLSFDLCHMLIAGKTGSGKSYMVEYLLMCYLYRYGKNNLYVCDPKRADLYNLSLPTSHKCWSADAPAMFDLVYDLLLERQKTFARRAKDKINLTYKNVGLKPILLVVDEYASMKQYYNTDSNSKKVYQKMLSILTQIVLMGRQLGVFCIIITQKPSADTISTDIRSNLVFRCLLGNSDTTEQITAFEQSVKHQVLRGAGQGYYLYAVNGASTRLIDVPILDFDINKAFARLLKDNKKKK